MPRLHYPRARYKERYRPVVATLIVSGIVLLGSPQIANANETTCSAQLNACLSAKKGIAHQCVMDGVARLDKAVQPIFRDAYQKCKTEGERLIVCVEATIESINEERFSKNKEGAYAPIDPSQFTPCWGGAKADLQSCQAAYDFCRGV